LESGKSILPKQPKLHKMQLFKVLCVSIVGDSEVVLLSGRHLTWIMWWAVNKEDRHGFYSLVYMEEE
jgi:hypothetical protein